MLVRNVSQYIRTVALLALALIELPNEQGAFFDNVGNVKMVTRDGDLFPYSVHTGATLTFTVNTTQISVSAVAARSRGNPGQSGSRGPAEKGYAPPADEVGQN